MHSLRSALVAGLLLAPAVVAAQDLPQAFVGAHVIPVAGAEIPDGVLVIHGGRIVGVGPIGSVEVPAGAEVHDVSGLVIMPGLVDTHSHIGSVEGGDGSAPIQPDVRVLDSINPLDPRIQKAQAGGVTTANIMSGSGHLLSGQTLYVKLRDGRVIDDIALRNPDGSPMGGIKMANGTNSRRDPPFPGTRAKSAALVRAEFIRAREYRDRIVAADGDPEKEPPRDLGLEALADVLEGSRTVHHHTHRHDDIVTVLRLAEEFGFRVVLHHVSDGWKVADEIAAADAAVSLISVDSPGGKIEAKDNHFRTGGVLERAGALVGFHTDDGITDSRFFLRQAALAVRAGMTRDGAIAGVTLAGARMLDLQDRVGSLEEGKDADFIVLSGDPLSVYTHVLETWVDGVRVFDRSQERDLLHSVGGYGASDGQSSHDHILSAEIDY